MEIQGKVSDLATRGEVSTFTLRTTDKSDPRVQAASSLMTAIKNGDEVAVNGSNPADPPFLADSVKKLGVTGKRFPWIPIAVAVGVVAIAIAVFLVLKSSGTSWTIMAVDSGQPAAGVGLNLKDGTGSTVAGGTTNAQGKLEFPKLQPGSYTVLGVGGTVATANLQKGKNLTSTVKVRSPYTWTVETDSCNRPSNQNMLNLISPAGTVTTAATDATGQHAFTNLKPGRYRVLGPYDRSVQAVIAETTVQPLAKISVDAPVQPGQPMIQCLFVNGLLLHPILKLEMNDHK